MLTALRAAFDFIGTCVTDDGNTFVPAFFAKHNDQKTISMTIAHIPFRTFFLLLLTLVLSSVFHKVHTQSIYPEAHPDAAKGHRFKFATGHAHITKPSEDATSERSTLGALVFHYDYLFGKKWGLGTHNDVIIEQLPVAHVQNGEEHLSIERELPFATRIIGSYKPGKHTSFMFGLGDEINGSGHHFLSTVGIDYGWELSDGWEIGCECTYDFVRRASNNWVLGVGISKTFHFSGHKTH